ncbi:MAG: SDR family NAD(P)-dependent oxidoreductase [Paracoccaceae bacterium]
MTTNNFTGKRYWLVGASDGLGKALAQRLSRTGAHVIVSSRDAEKLEKVSETLSGSSSYQVVDISDDASVENAAKQIGQVDGVVLLAGVYWPLSAQNWNPAQATEMANVNFTGYLRVLGQVVPDFVDRDDGHIVITSSLTGFRGLPGSIGYTASKAGTMSLAECLYADLRTSNVRVQVVNPGFIKTRMTEKNTFNMPFIMSADEAAQEMFEHMCTSHFKKSFPFGFSLFFRLAQFFPDWLYYRIFT